jgi:hypothetical protein
MVTITTKDHKRTMDKFYHELKKQYPYMKDETYNEMLKIVPLDYKQAMEFQRRFREGT